MNNRAYRLVFSRFRNMLVAVEETASGAGKTRQGETTGAAPAVSSGDRATTQFTLRHAAFGVFVLGGAMSVHAQIVAGGANAPSVIQTQNGIPQVNISRPSGAGVSLNTYGQFDVQKNGAILNNSPTIVSTQQAGQINGNPNFGAGESARIIVNQVNSSAASQINGYLEVAGRRAEVVIANGSGISVNGGGFLNTSRAILTTGTPNFAPDGSLVGLNVTGGNITVQGAGLDGSTVDQVDLLARAVQVNAAIYAGNALNVVAGANSVNHDTLNATPIAGDGPAPDASIDVSQLGGMYANRIRLASNEFGVGVSTRGVIAAQAGDLELLADGRVVLAGSTSASGNLTVQAREGITNSGTTYAQQSLAATTAGDLSNSGTLAAQQHLTGHAASVASTGTLGAGMNSDGSLAQAGDLNLTADDVLSAHGNNVAGGNATLSGAALDLAGSQTQARGNVALTAGSGNMNLAYATTGAGGTLTANASSALVNDGGNLSSQGAMQLTGASVSNAGGQIVSQSTLDAGSDGAINNRQGVIQAAGRESVKGASLDNTAGRIVSLNGDGLSVVTTGALVNATGTTATGETGGVVGSNGGLDVGAGILSNQGQLTAQGDASVRAQTFDNHDGSVSAGGSLTTTVAGALSNQRGTLTGAATAVSAASLENSSGDIDGDQVSVRTTGDLVNRGGTIRQFSQSGQTIIAGGALDNTGGTIASNASNLNVSAHTLTNDSGAIQHAGSSGSTA
ncbi:filamentous hemagglutinin N-terminal domain-containing protein [Paraburkholderia sp. SIMBA_030]|uniref:two-partner secretion domain-containing protein n=1 Tax=Paraburkholderia sp. SIMBA_030 TaxID=3085773 RepID=UPI00397C9938